MTQYCFAKSINLDYAKQMQPFVVKQSLDYGKILDVQKSFICYEAFKQINSNYYFYYYYYYFFWLPGIQITTFYEINTKHAINNIFIASHILREQLFVILVAITGFRETDMTHIMINCSCRHNYGKYNIIENRCMIQLLISFVMHQCFMIPTTTTVIEARIMPTPRCLVVIVGFCLLKSFNGTLEY